MQSISGTSTASRPRKRIKYPSLTNISKTASYGPIHVVRGCIVRLVNSRGVSHLARLRFSHLNFNNTNINTNTRARRLAVSVDYVAGVDLGLVGAAIDWRWCYAHSATNGLFLVETTTSHFCLVSRLQQSLWLISDRKEHGLNAYRAYSRGYWLVWLALGCDETMKLRIENRNWRGRKMTSGPD